MSANADNRMRAFADVVSIDAWHDEFSTNRLHADLHADVVFGTARVGGETDSPIRFRLAIKRAEVVLIIPELEPISIDRASVARDSPVFEGRRVETIERRSQLNAQGKGSGSISRENLGLSASVEGKAESDLSKSQKVEISSPVQLMLVTQSKTVEGFYRWIITPAMEKTLEGRPWDAASQPRLRIIDERKDRTKGLPPVVRIEVRCRREDLAIEDLQIKSKSIWEKTKSRIGFRNRLAAAESYIRDRLRNEGLEVNNIEDRFGKVTLGSVIAQPS
jgi:hypothetical protein